MSQDNETCAKCGELCGHNNDKVYWWGKKKNWTDNALCGKCKNKFVYKFHEYFGVLCSNDDSGLIVEWHELDKPLDSFKYDGQWRCFYYEVSDKDRYKRLRNKAEVANDSLKDQKAGI